MPSQGICMSSAGSCTSRDWLGRLWRHECERVYSDRLLSDVEVKAFEEVILDVAKKNLNLDVSFMSRIEVRLRA